MFTKEDITFTFSGGSSNSDPDRSLGGDPSLQTIVNKRLFDDVSETETKTGNVDYRCFYAHNESNVDTLYDTEVYIAYTVPGDVTVKVGFDFENERQNLTVVNAAFIFGGSFVITYSDSTNHDLTVNWSANLSTWAANFQQALRTINNLENVFVSAFTSNNNVIFEIDFFGTSSSRYHELIVLKTGGNHLLATQITSISIVKSVNGGPINRIADIIDVDTTIPNNIVFYDTITIGDLRPLDSVPIWIKRTTPPNTTAVENDGFTLRIKGRPIQP